MTNFEWVKDDDIRLETFLKYGIAMDEYTGKVTGCATFPCNHCSFFNSEKTCSASREEWLNKEHNNQPLYEEGDIVISKKGDLYVVFKECEGNLKDNSLIVADNAINFDLGLGTYINKDEIKRKVGNIKKEENNGL